MIRFAAILVFLICTTTNGFGQKCKDCESLFDQGFEDWDSYSSSKTSGTLSVSMDISVTYNDGEVVRDSVQISSTKEILSITSSDADVFMDSEEVIVCDHYDKIILFASFEDMGYDSKEFALREYSPENLRVEFREHFDFSSIIEFTFDLVVYKALVMKPNNTSGRNSGAEIKEIVLLFDQETEQFKGYKTVYKMDQEIREETRVWKEIKPMKQTLPEKKAKHFVFKGNQIKSTYKDYMVID